MIYDIYRTAILLSLASAPLHPPRIRSPMAANSTLGAISAEVSALNDYAAVRYTNIAFLCFMVYDHSITFEAEVSRIWTLKWRLPKILFLINRYVVPPMLIFDGVVPAIYNLPESLCTFITKWTSWFVPGFGINLSHLQITPNARPTIISLGTVEVILILRVSAVCGHREAIRRFLVGLFACEMIVMVTLSSIIMSKTTGFPGGDLFPGCLFWAPKYFYAVWIPAVVFESTIILITRYYLSAYEGSKQVNVTLRVLARDSMIYFLIMFSVLLANLFIARFGRDFLGSLLIAPSSVIACVGAARMMMNLREISTGEGTPHSRHFENVDNTIEFREPQPTTVGDA
ncbi:hypothetical protein C8J57DRAFT_1727677 [Mycena rebaudengoi]|nr:hypothetical protein C8J57DRAFT_1727677 [Mycena rebaudengoi]